MAFEIYLDEGFAESVPVSTGFTKKVNLTEDAAKKVVKDLTSEFNYCYCFVEWDDEEPEEILNSGRCDGFFDWYE